ncbi:DUF4395 domain-containing protein [Fictibacillus aquaticus]|uniref:DUF4395 domain-containing protein n=1 Tax=Fictibacillus aquaticus TaxID=2021314 RepID=A0A235FCI0_9BACL|nr:DUF4395 domain-containing protein [Fictibacillus aquaticus]OYD58643.1 hypothetical protein CGZ90_01715 [Fictibacillus aquaticus]
MGYPAKSIPKPLVQANQAFIVLSVLLSWLLHPFLLVLPLSAGLISVLFKYNPIIASVKPLLRKPGSAYQQEDFDQQQFNQWIAVICLVFAVIFFSIGWNTLGYIFSGMVFLAAAVALTGFCVGCFIRFQWQQFQYKKRKHKSEQKSY